MSRSRKLPIVKDKPRVNYWKTVRRTLNQTVSQFSVVEDEDDLNDLPDPKTIVNDYDYCDYVSDMRFLNTGFFSPKTREDQDFWKLKYSRK